MACLDFDGSLTLFYTRGFKIVGFCFTCDGSSTKQVFPLIFNIGMVIYWYRPARLGPHESGTIG